MTRTYTADERMNFAPLAIRSTVEVLQEEPDLGELTEHNLSDWLLAMLDERDMSPYRGLIRAALNRAEGLN